MEAAEADQLTCGVCLIVSPKSKRPLRSRRIVEARALGRGGVMMVAKASGLSRQQRSTPALRELDAASQNRVDGLRSICASGGVASGWLTKTQRSSAISMPWSSRVHAGTHNRRCVGLCKSTPRLAEELRAKGRHGESTHDLQPLGPARLIVCKLTAGARRWLTCGPRYPICLHRRDGGWNQKRRRTGTRWIPGKGADRRFQERRAEWL